MIEFSDNIAKFDISARRKFESSDNLVREFKVILPDSIFMNQESIEYSDVFSELSVNEHFTDSISGAYDLLVKSTPGGQKGTCPFSNHDTATPELYTAQNTLSLHYARPIWRFVKSSPPSYSFIF